MNLECIPCFQRQAIEATRMTTNDEQIQKAVLEKVMKALLEMGWYEKPPTIAQKVHSIVRMKTGNSDPYKAVKKEYNDIAVKLYPDLKSIVDSSKDPLLAAIRLAIAGNIIDFGPTPTFDLNTTIKDCLTADFPIFKYEEFKKKLDNSSTLLYLADNTGEIVFDKLLIETIIRLHAFEKIVFAIKEGPILNDATEEDARYVGMADIPNLTFLKISNSEHGTGVSRGSQEFENILKQHDLVISKGQGNYEMLSEYKEIFFLLKAKCPVIARDLGVKVGEMVFGGKPLDLYLR
ncbi:MAG: damage-control phosphatase ARMT1 family protein [Candidatus Methanofastidiosia archaeon]